MNLIRFSRPSSFSVFLLLSFCLVLLGSVPFGHALEIHHIFSEIDHDGHQHSEFDLCQWVQHHTANSLAWEAPHASPCWMVSRSLFLEGTVAYSSLSSSLYNSRGPPLSCHIISDQTA